MKCGWLARQSEGAGVEIRPHLYDCVEGQPKRRVLLQPDDEVACGTREETGSEMLSCTAPSSSCPTRLVCLLLPLQVALPSKT